MLTRTRHKAPAVRPGLTRLEDRCTPTVNSLLVAGFTPGMGGAGFITFGGLVSDSYSDPVNTARLEVSYVVTDSMNNVLDQGPLDLVPVHHTTTMMAYGATIPRSVMPGNSETISIYATDIDSGGGTEEGVIQASQVEAATTHAVLPVSPVRGISTLGLGAWNIDRGNFYGLGQGRLTVCRTPEGAISAKGEGCVRVWSDSARTNQIQAQASGKFAFGYTPTADFALCVNGSGVVSGRTATPVINPNGNNTLTVAQGTTYRAAVKGQLSLTHSSTGLVTANVKGSACLSASGPNASFTASAKNVAICLKIDNFGPLKIGVTGKIALHGTLNTGMIRQLPA